MRRDIERKNKLLGLDLPQTEATNFVRKLHAAVVVSVLVFLQCAIARSGPMSAQGLS